MSTSNEQSKKLSEFALSVKRFRLKRGLTQQDLADMSNLDRKTVNRIENASYSINITTLFALAKALEVRPSDLLE